MAAPVAVLAAVVVVSPVTSLVAVAILELRSCAREYVSDCARARVCVRVQL